VVAHLAFRQEQDDRSAFTVADGVELRVQPTLGSPDTTGNIPFLSRLAVKRLPKLTPDRHPILTPYIMRGGQRSPAELVGVAKPGRARIGLEG
jgi:hypothetical protein